MKPTQFKDSNGKTWDCKINLGTAMMVDKSDFTVLTDQPIILSRYNQDAIKVMVTDTAVLFAVIGVLVRNQCNENFDFEITSEADEYRFQQEFTRSIDGSVIEEARKAFVEALSDFFPAAKTVLSTFLKTIDEYREKIAKRLQTEILPMMTNSMDQMIDQEIQKLKESLPANQSVTS